MKLNLEEPRKVVVAIADASIVAVILPTETVTEIRRKNTRMRTVMGDPVEELDQKAYALDFWDALIESWAGIQDRNGQDIPCSRQTKYEIVSRYSEIALKINEELDTARRKTLEVESALEKN